MFWADHVAEQIRTRYKEKIKKGEPIVIRDEKTLSGRVHVGSLRGVAIHGIVSEVLREEGIHNKFFFEYNDFDPMDGLPIYLDKEKFLPFMGKLLCEVPSPDGKTKNTPNISEMNFGTSLQKQVLIQNIIAQANYIVLVNTMKQSAKLFLRLMSFEISIKEFRARKKKTTGCP